MLNFIFQILILVGFLYTSFFAFSLPEINYYEILDIPMEATLDDIKRGFRKQAVKYHPDRAINMDVETANEKMAEINEAYDVLKNPQSRSQYDEFLSSSVSDYADVKKNASFYSAFEQAVSSPSLGFSKVMWFEIMDVIRGKLNDQQVHSIVKVIVDVDVEFEMVRRAGITVLENYFKQLYIEDVDLLLILASSLNKRDDQGLKSQPLETIKSLKDRVLRSSSTALVVQNQSEQRTEIQKRDSSALAVYQEVKEPKREREIGIKKRAKRITDKWFAYKFQYSHYIDQILEVITGSSDQYTGSDFLRAGTLDALENNVEKLNSGQIQQLQDFSKSSLGGWRDRRFKRQIERIVKKWEQLDSHTKGTALQEWTGDKRSLIRIVEEGKLYATDPELYSIKSLGEGLDYLKQPNLSPERVQQIVDYVLAFIYHFDSGMHFIRFIRENDKKFPKSSKDKVIDKVIVYLHTLSEVGRLARAAGNFLSENHLDQMLNQVLPFIKTKRGMRGGTQFLRFVKEYMSTAQQARMVEVLKDIPARTLKDAEGFINMAGEHLSEEDQNNIRNRIKQLASSCSTGFQKSQQ